MTGNDERKISSLRDLPLDIAPPRDLWQGIEARLTERSAGHGSVRSAVEPARRFGRAGRMRLIAAAAMIAALAVGVWIGRTVLPGAGKPPARGELNANVPFGEPGTWHAAYVLDPKYTRDRAELVKGLEARLASLPPQSRAKVQASLKAINDSKRALEEELGKDPSNALLQELLVNTYQDEMRALTAVHEAGHSGEGI